ncbi:cysteine desulfurase family protein [Virgibacillus soli]|uniref:Cysteine desulfurase family protein n=1 Tax=Paracerasibacillus soli TaxID=480284 RepID=A0ABU5CQM8_9BACI|nr:cysteine desulfurase family protein [Virgibacillus soli]MDY0408675.1 cysteine desulfurase family protein [Virgibacillus soli]
MIYLDNSATTKPHKEIIESFQQVTTRFFGNPSSIHQFGGDAERLLLKAKEQAAQLLEVAENEVFFTSGGTEGNNLAIKGIAFEHQNRGKHIITTEIEHPSVYDACKSLETFGFEITYLPVNEAGVISLHDLEAAIREDTILVSVMHVNNEIGSIQPIEEIGHICSQYPKLYFHVDDVQGFGKVPLNLERAKVDLCTISGHKFHGLKGTGILVKRNHISLHPLFHGGEQQAGIRSGTENLAGIVAMVKAMRLIKERETDERSTLRHLYMQLREGLQEVEGVFMNSPENGAPHIVNISVPGLKPEVMIHTLGQKNIFISTKSACSSKQLDESRIIKACGFSLERSQSALRISLSYDNTNEEISEFLDIFKKAMNELKKVMR